MKKQDIDMMTELETEVVDNSFDKEGLVSRFRNIILGAAIATALGLGLLAFGAGAASLAAVFVAYVFITALEKVSYVRMQSNSRSAIRKLVHRVEELEGVPATPDNAQASQFALSSERRAA